MGLGAQSMRSASQDRARTVPQIPGQPGVFLEVVIALPPRPPSPVPKDPTPKPLHWFGSGVLRWTLNGSQDPFDAVVRRDCLLA